MTPQTKQLYEAVKAITRLSFISRPFVVLREALSAFEQSIEQPEAIAGDKTIIEIWKEWCEKDISWTDAALGAMRDFTSQQTSAKDKEIKELKQRISAIKEKLPDNKIRDLNPIWVRDEIISELEKQK